MSAQGVEAQRTQKGVLDNIRYVKEFNPIRRDRQNQCHSRQQKDSIKEKKLVQKYKYCDTRH